MMSRFHNQNEWNCLYLVCAMLCCCRCFRFCSWCCCYNYCSTFAVRECNFWNLRFVGWFSSLCVYVWDYYLLAVLIDDSIFVMLFLMVLVLLRHCIGVLMMFFNPWAIWLISFSWCIFFIFQYHVVVFRLCDLLLKCVYLDRLCWPWSM